MTVMDKLRLWNRDRRSLRGGKGVADLRSPTVAAAVVAGVYAVLAMSWIVFGGEAQRWVQDTVPALGPWLQPVESWGLVVVTSLVLFFVVRSRLARRNRVVRSLHESNEQLREHLDRNPLALVEWDRDLRVREWSKGAEELFGWSADEARGRSWLDWSLVHPDDRGSLERLFQNIKQKEPGGTLSVQRNVSRDGKEIWCEWYTSWVRDSNGRFVSVLSLVNDITRDREMMGELQRMNRDLELKVARRTRDLAAANRDLRAFTHSISNDLRAPVRSMIGFTELLRERHTEDLPTEARKQLVYLLAAGRQLDHLIEDLIDYGRIGSEGVTLEPVGLLEAARKAIRSLEEVFPEAEAAASLPQATETIPADPALLHRVLTNLLENALRYRHPRRPARIEISSKRARDEVQVRVRDNGPGIPPEHRDRVFRLFERLHSEESHPGSGMGLAIVKKSMNLMGGQVTVHDHDGPGATFLLRFPVFSPLMETPEEAVRGDGDLSGNPDTEVDPGASADRAEHASAREDPSMARPEPRSGP